jgi:hypothetical protein
MKTTLNKLGAVLLLGFLAISPLRAQTGASLEADTNNAGNYSEAVEKQKLQLEKDLETDRFKTEADKEKNIASAKYDNERLMVHDIAWNSWVIFVIAIFFFGYLRDKRRHETIQLMVEKGTPITPEVLAALRKKSRIRASYDPQGYLCWGVILVAVAFGLWKLYVQASWIVLAIGVAFLLLFIIDRIFGRNDGQTK